MVKKYLILIILIHLMVIIPTMVYALTIYSTIGFSGIIESFKYMSVFVVLMLYILSAFIYIYDLKKESK